MPHVEIVFGSAGAGALLRFHERFAARTLQEEDRVTKARACFLAHDGRSALVECLAVEGYLRQSFFVLLTGKPDGAMVRLLPRTSPEKTDGVKRCVVWIARWLEAVAAGASGSGTSVGATNLEDHLARPLPDGVAAP